MLSRDKRASLSSSLLGAKDNTPPSAEETAPAEAPEASAHPAAVDARQETQAGPETGNNVLYAKGAASASGFRPWYWSYEREGKLPPGAGAGTVTPFPGGASAPAPVDMPAAEPETEAAAGTLADEPVVEPPDAQDDFAAKAQAIRRARLQRPSAPAAETAERAGAKRSRLFVIVGGFASLAVAAAVGAFFALSMERSGRETAAPSVATRQPTVAATTALPAKPADSAPATPAATPPKAKEAVAAVKPEPKPAIETQQASPAPPPSAEPPPPPAAPAAKLSPQEIAELVSRGDQLLATGDIAAARLFYERAAEQGSAPAATAAGKTYDPLFLEEVHARGIRGDAVRAAQWYRKGSAAGDKQADIRMERLMARYGG